MDHLKLLEAEAIHIIREAVALARNPVVLFSGGKDSTVLAHLVLRAFHPGRPPVPLLHVDSTWEFRDVLAFRDAFAARYDFRLRVHANEEGRALGLNPIDHGDIYTSEMRTRALRQGLDAGGHDFILGGARRDEESARAKERVFSIREPNHTWEPRQQRPELWHLYNGELDQGQSVRIYPLSNWTEQDLWIWILRHRIELAPLYFAAEREVIEVDGTPIVLDDPARLPSLAALPRRRQRVRFRTLGCWPVTGALASDAQDAASVMLETLGSSLSERMGRVSDHGSLEAQKRQGYF
jgi:sulfate adenylyltransferase subunit 2